MEKEKFEQLLLKTAFSCMACDGDIDHNEVDHIRELANTKNLFGDVDVDKVMNEMLSEISSMGGQFLRNYFTELSEVNLDESEEMQLIKVSIDTINADDKVEYSEIKFFKIIRDKLKIDNESILDQMPEIEEYLEQDIISPSYIANLTEDYLGGYAVPVVSNLSDLSSKVKK